MSIPYAVRKRATRDRVVHFAITRFSVWSWCSYGEYEVRVKEDELPHETPITCIRCLVEAGLDVV